MLIWAISAVASLALAVSILGYRRVSVARQVSAEGIESDEVSKPTTQLVNGLNLSSCEA